MTKNNSKKPLPRLPSRALRNGISLNTKAPDRAVSSSLLPASSGIGKKARVFIVDDHTFMRHGLVKFLSSQPEIEVCGEAENALDALTAIGKLRPDVVLTDIVLPGKSGLELVKDIRTMYPEIHILVISLHEESYYAERVLHAGAHGYIIKRDGDSQLLTAIQKVLAGQIFVSESIAGKILQIFSRGRTAATDSPAHGLTDRELQVFELIGQARTTRAIAEALHISVKTAEAHRSNIKEKLNISGGPELIRLAVRWVESKTASLN
jgi:DNA-binding NarL/FixJ family response regulator